MGSIPDFGALSALDDEVAVSAEQAGLRPNSTSIANNLSQNGHFFRRPRCRSRGWHNSCNRYDRPSKALADPAAGELIRCRCRADPLASFSPTQLAGLPAFRGPFFMRRRKLGRSDPVERCRRRFAAIPEVCLIVRCRCSASGAKPATASCRSIGPSRNLFTTGRRVSAVKAVLTGSGGSRDNSRLSNLREFQDLKRPVLLVTAVPPHSLPNFDLPETGDSAARLANGWQA